MRGVSRGREGRGGRGVPVPFLTTCWAAGGGASLIDRLFAPDLKQMEDIPSKVKNLLLPSLFFVFYSASCQGRRGRRWQPLMRLLNHSLPSLSLQLQKADWSLVIVQV